MSVHNVGWEADMCPLTALTPHTGWSRKVKKHWTAIGS